MKLVNYRCSVCETDVEEIFLSGEEIPSLLDRGCPKCDSVGTLEIWNFKNNDQVQKFNGEW